MFRQTPIQRGTGGFSTAELLVVTVLLGIVGAIVVPQVSSNAEQYTLAAARTIAQDVLYAQDLAVTTQSPVTLSFSPSAPEYSISDSQGELLSHPIDQKPFTVDLLDDPSISQVDIEISLGVDLEVVFDALGTPSTGGTIMLTHPDVDMAVVVTLHPATGNVTVTRQPRQ